MKRPKKASMMSLRKKVRSWKETDFGIEVVLQRGLSFNKDHFINDYVFESTALAKEAVIQAKGFKVCKI